MEEGKTDRITLYTSRWCAQSIGVEHFLEQNQIEVSRISIDGNDEAREELIELNGGYASVPTLLFPDGTKLTEPSLSELRVKLQLEAPPGLVDRIRDLLERKSDGN